MALKDSIKKMHTLLNQLSKDLSKAEKGNKAAAQRTRTASIQFAKIAKQFRKESVQAHKKKAAPKKRKTTTTKKKTKTKKAASRQPNRRKTKWKTSSSQRRKRT